MNKAERIKQVEQEIAQFDYKRLQMQKQAQQAQVQLQKDLSDLHDGMLTRQGEIFCLKRLIEEESQAKEKEMAVEEQTKKDAAKIKAVMGKK